MSIISTFLIIIGDMLAFILYPFTASINMVLYNLNYAILPFTSIVTGILALINTITSMYLNMLKYAFDNVTYDLLVIWFGLGISLWLYMIFLHKKTFGIASLVVTFP